MRRFRAPLALLAIALCLAGCAYYNTLYNARKRYEEAIEGRQSRLDKRRQDEENYWRAMQDWVAAGGSGEEMLAKLERAVEDSTARADSLKSVLADSLGLIAPLAPSDSLELERSYTQYDSLSRARPAASAEGHNTAPAMQTGLVRRPRRPRKSEFRSLIPAEERLLDACITKCAKVISLYPDSKWRDDAIFLMGKALYEKRYYSDAHIKFSELRRYYSDSPYIDEARLYEARAIHAEGDQVEARAIWEELLGGTAAIPVRRAAGLELAGSVRADGDQAGAAAIYRRLLDADLAGRERAAIQLEFGRSLRSAGNPVEAAAAFDAVLGSHPDLDQAFDASLAAAQALDEAGESDAARERLERLSRDQHYFSRAPVALMELGRIAEREGRIDDAQATYRRIVHTYPGTDHAADALLASASLLREAGEELDLARRTLELLISENPESPAAESARRELTDLKRFLRLRREAEASTGPQAERARFLLAEHLLVAEERHAEALDLYLGLIRDAPETAWRPRADLAAAWIWKGPLASPERADSVYRAIFEEFPGTEAAAISAAALDLQVPTVTFLDQEPTLPVSPPVAPAADSSAAVSPLQPGTSPLPDTDADAELLQRRRRSQASPAPPSPSRSNASSAPDAQIPDASLASPVMPPLSPSPPLSPDPDSQSP
jgi:TolA-binding protein